MRPQRVVVIGHGMAGARLAEEIRRRDPGCDRVALTIVGAEPCHAYNRVLLSSVLAGSLAPDAVWLHDGEWAQRNGVDLRLGVPVTSIDLDSGHVRLDEGSLLPYDTLVLATGSRPWVPPTEGLREDDGALATGVVTFRTLDDCAAIIGGARGAARVAVLGGGLLGLEAARGVAGRGTDVTVVHPVSHVMDRQLDPAAGRVLARTLLSQGIGLRLGVAAARYVPGDGLKLDDGSHVAADLVVVSAGVQPETSLAAAAGITIDRGIVVDDQLRTSDPRVRAIGDCAQHPGTVGGLVQSAWEQASILADLLTDHHPVARYRGTPLVTRLKARGVDLASLGDPHIDVDDPGAEVLCLHDPARGRYAKLVLRDDRVTGAILVGAPDAAATITQHYERAIPAPIDRLALLLGRALSPDATAETRPAELPESAVVCRCNAVTKGQLVEAWLDGATNPTDLAGATRATTGCGGCAERVHGIADWLSSAESPAAQSTTKGSSG